MTDGIGLRPGRMFPFDPAWLSVPAGLLAVGAVLRYAPLAADTARMLAITLFCVVLWIGSPVEPWFTALLGIGLIGVTFSTDLALFGFRSPATWLVVVGLLIGEAARASGLAELVERLALNLMPERITTDAVAVYRYLLVVLSVGSFALAVLVPSSLVRVLILAPILGSIGELFTEREARIGIFLGPLFATYYGASGVLTGSLANIIITGLVESGGGPAISWAEWSLWMGPVMGIGRVVVIVAVTYLLYRPRDRDAMATPENVESIAASPRERRMLAFLLVGVAIWATDFIHGLHPVFGAVVVALLSFLPRIGVIDHESVGETDFSIIFFLGAIFAIAEGLQRTDFTDLAAETLLSYLPADPSLPLVLVFVVAVSMLLAFVMEGMAVASVITPVFVTFAESAGISIVPVAMVEAVALNSYFFPYQSAVLVAILGLGVVDTVELSRMASVYTIATLVILLPIQIGLFALFF
ncbi:SLC13 family permease [Halobellus ordinarius]|uniref:SLC13 family permease n=1 Tax=Halobellus ordinarius TaxID=3075120 RepID=UPI0028800833|nr:SLC13 family permease [Halobellus sp. ZY16]